MSRSGLILSIAAIFLGYLFPLLASAETQTERIDRLIEGLASPNKLAIERGPMIRLPADYDKAAQAKVFAAYEALLAEGEDAFPQLTEHLLDERYCATVASASTESNVTVGYMCGRIIRAHLGAHLEQLPRGLGSWRPGFLVVENAKFADWLRKNKDRPLWELQVEALNSAIKQLKEAEPEELIRNHRADREQVTESLAQGLKQMKKLRKQLKKREEPLVPKGPFDPSLGTRGLEMLGLPKNNIGPEQ